VYKNGPYDILFVTEENTMTKEDVRRLKALAQKLLEANAESERARLGADTTGLSDFMLKVLANARREVGSELMDLIWKIEKDNMERIIEGIGRGK
jgi:hypothetical protein